MDINQHNTQTQIVSNDEISIRELIIKIGKCYHYLLSKWLIIVFSGALGGSLGFFYAWSKKPLYTATTTFVFEDAKSGAGSQYAGLAALAGMSVGGGGGLFHGDNLLELYKSRTMLQKTLLSSGVFDGKSDLLINRYIQIKKLRKVWEKSPSLAKLSFSIPQERYTRAHDSIMTKIVGDINNNCLKVDKPDKKLGIIDVDVKSTDEQFAKIFNDRVVETVNQFYIETKTKKQNANILVLQYQADSVRRILNAAIGVTASSLDANPNINPALQVLRVPSQRKQIEVQTNTSIYAEIVKNLEMARLAARQDAPLIQLVDQAVFPLKVDKTSKIKFAIIGGVLFGFFAALTLLVKKELNELFKNNEN